MIIAITKQWLTDYFPNTFSHIYMNEKPNRQDKIKNLKLCNPHVYFDDELPLIEQAIKNQIISYQFVDWKNTIEIIEGIRDGR